MRKWMATKLVQLARRIDPPNKAAMAFMIDVMTDAMITGHAVYRVDPSVLYSHDEQTKH